MAQSTLDSDARTSASTTSMKRKIDEAFDALDDALQPRDRPTPPKRANSSIYGSLAKYGIRTFNKPSASKPTSTPTLTALLSRSRSKKHRKQLPTPQLSKSSSATPDYSPCSTEAFLQRLSTFTLSTYPSKPPQIDAVAASKAGWINEGGKDRLYCAICKVGWVVAGRDGMSKDAANALVEKLQTSLVEMHKEGCPWRVRQCDELVYRIPLQSPTGLARQIKTQATELEPVMNGIAIRYPLSSTQVQSLAQIISSVPDTVSMFSPPPSPSRNETEIHPQAMPSTNSVITSLFGWSLVSTPPPLPRMSSSASLAAARTHSRASSVQSVAVPSREGTPAPGAIESSSQFTTPVKSNAAVISTPINGRNSLGSPNTEGTTVTIHNRPPQQKDALLYCRMCQRRIGLWAFTIQNTSESAPSQQIPSTTRPQRHFDVLREHRSYCPYVVKSTSLPSIPSYPAPPTPTPRSSFNLTRAGTSSSLTEGQGSTSTFNLRRTGSLLAGASSLARVGTVSSSVSPASAGQGQHLVEGWRAVLSVVLRSGMAERSRMRAQPPSSTPAPTAQTGSVSEEAGEEYDDAMSGVVALVDGVKQHGGKQLLAYVRGLLG